MTAARRILQLSTHSTRVPSHGGELRSTNTARVLQEAGFSVSSIVVGVREDRHPPDDARESILDVAKAMGWGRSGAVMMLGDLASLHTVEDTPALRERFFSLTEAAEPDLLVFEHPWLWPLAREMPRVASGALPVIYNSQNVEMDLKRRMVEDADPWLQREVRRLLPEVEALECDLLRRAYATIACTEADAARFRAIGAARVVVAGNGAVRHRTGGAAPPLPPGVPPDMPFAYMIGSWHAPNYKGFEEFVLPQLPALPLGQRVVVAGRVSDWIGRELDESGVLFPFRGRMPLLGVIDDDAHAALVARAACVLLPIAYGGGSNIKTAEALLTDRVIVGSPAAFRGFGAYLDLPGITVAEDAAAFGAAMFAALAAPGAVMRDPARTAPLTWDAMLAPIVDLVRDVLRPPA